MTTGPLLTGMACRVPGASSLEEFWELLVSGESATDRPAREPLRHPGGFVDDVTGFDAAAFGMNDRDAAAADPQQRLLLETAWQAVADSGFAPSVLQESRVGVFVGCCADDYALLSAQAGSGRSPYTFTGTSRTMLANRVSHHFGFTGPSLTVDTGQSSSLTALHLARVSLENGDCDVALVAGVHLNLHPFREEAMEALGILSPDGVCRPLDERADGTVRGEGCLVVVLSRRAGALPAYAELVSTAVGHDGNAGGLTEPNSVAQAELVGRALERAGLRPHELQYAELHGTGTPVGDRVEARSLTRALDLDARGAELSVGSVKATIGHLEGAAGLAGLVKVALMLDRQHVVPTPGHRSAGSGSTRLRVATATTAEWLDHACVSSFGIGGSNVCAVLSRAFTPGRAPGEVPVDEHAGPAGHHAFVVGGSDEKDARRRAEQLAAHLDSTGAPAPAALAAGLQTTERHQTVRYGIAVATEVDPGDALRAFARGEHTPSPVSHEGQPLVLCFPGQGTQRHRMAMDLYDSDPVFARDLDEVDAVLAPLLGDSVRRLLTDPEADLARYDVCQPVIFAVEVALAAQVRRWGAPPDLVLGHSLGELVAVHVAGHLDLDDAARLVVERGALMQRVAGDGAMASVLGDLSRVGVDSLGAGVDVAARNSPTSLTISGPRAAVVATCEGLDRLPGVRTRPLTSGGASHSHLMRPVARELDAVARSLTWHPAPAGAPRVISATTGAVLDTFGHHWGEHLVRPVHYARAVAHAHDLGGRVFLEVGPGRTLTALHREVLRGKDAHTLPSLWGSGVSAVTSAYADLAAAGSLRTPAWAVRPPSRDFVRSHHWLYGSPGSPPGNDHRDVDEPREAGRVVTGELSPETNSPGTSGPPQEIDVSGAIRSSLTRLVKAPVESLDDPFASFADLGVDSIAAMSLAEELSRLLDRPISAAALYDFPSPASLAGALTTGEDL